MVEKMYLVESSSGSYDSHTRKKHGLFDDYDEAVACTRRISNHCRAIFRDRPDPESKEGEEYWAKFEWEMEFNNCKVIPLVVNDFKLNGV